MTEETKEEIQKALVKIREARKAFEEALVMVVEINNEIPEFDTNEEDMTEETKEEIQKALVKIEEGMEAMFELAEEQYDLSYQYSGPEKIPESAWAAISAGSLLEESTEQVSEIIVRLREEFDIPQPEQTPNTNTNKEEEK